jgi:hypothetical protein
MYLFFLENEVHAFGTEILRTLRRWTRNGCPSVSPT